VRRSTGNQFVNPIRMRGWRRSDGRPADTALHISRSRATVEPAASRRALRRGPLLDTPSGQDHDALQSGVTEGGMDIVVWLRSLGLGKYEAIFREK
jgi:hypothetical protein